MIPHVKVDYVSPDDSHLCNLLTRVNVESIESKWSEAVLPKIYAILNHDKFHVHNTYEVE
jgi:hypothetical protein